MPRTVVYTSPSRRRSLAREMNLWLDRVLDPDYHRFTAGEVWRPAVNVYEDAEQYTVVADLAGVRVEQIELIVERGALVITGGREVPGLPSSSPRGSAGPAQPQTRYSGRSGPQQAGPAGAARPRPTRVHLMEIDHGRFRRAIELPGDVDVASIEASYRCGYLWIRLPKSFSKPGR